MSAIASASDDDDDDLFPKKRKKETDLTFDSDRERCKVRFVRSSPVEML